MMPTVGQPGPAQNKPTPTFGVRRPALGPVAIAGLGIVIALFIYLPFASRPFGVVDFSRFVPLLRNNPTFLARLKALVVYYAQEQGRLNIIPYAFIALKWSLFGWQVPLWQTARFIEMWFIVAGAYLILRDFGVARTAAVCSAALFVVAPPAMIAWERLSIGEPLGTLFLLLATWLATRYQGSARWRLMAAEIVLLLLAVAFTKEMLLVAVPFVLAVACSCSPEGTFERIKLTRRNLFLVAITVPVLCLASLAILYAALHSKPDALAVQYGNADITIDQAITPAILFSAPGYSLILPSLPTLLAIADLIFVGIIVLGWGSAIRRTSDKSELRRRAAMAFLLLVPGAVAYVPWNGVQSSYGLPFLLAPAFLLGYGLTALESRHRLVVVFSRAAVILMLISCAMSAHRFSRQLLALQRVNAQVANVVATSMGQDSTLIPIVGRPRLDSNGPGPTLARYVLAMTGRIPPAPVRDISCEDLARGFESTSTVLVVSYSSWCGSLPKPDQTIRRYFRYVDLSTLRASIDSVRVDVQLHRSSALLQAGPH